MKIYRFAKKDYTNFEELMDSYMHLRQHGFLISILGKTYEDYPIHLVHPKTINPNLPCVLIGTGAHGEEKAGPWGLAAYVKRMPTDILKYVNLSFLPDINPNGLVHETRYNIKDETTNSVVDENNPKKYKGLSRETAIIVKHKDLIKRLSADLLITLHENNDLESFYIYTCNYDKKYDGITKDLVNRLRGTMEQYYTQRADGEYQDCPKEGPYTIKDGVVTNLKDGTLEDFIVRTMKNPLSIVTETPVEGTTLNQRIKTNALIVNQIVQYYAKKGKTTG